MRAVRVPRLPAVVPRLLAPVIGLLGAAALVAAALLPEFVIEPGGGGGVVPLDPNRPGWLASLVGLLAQVGLVLGPVLMLFLRQSQSVAGGILVGAGSVGLIIRVVRSVQLGESPELGAGIGSDVDALGEALVIAAGVLALAALRVRPERPSDEVAPPPGEEELESDLDLA